MLPTTLVLIRHAHTENNGGSSSPRLVGWYDAPLSPLGRRQIEALRKRLAGEPRPSALYASPLRRARETAQAAAAGLGIPPRLVGSLKEINCGMLDGLPVQEVQSRYPDLWQRNLAQNDEGFAWPGGESYRDFRARVLDAIGRLASVHEGERIVVVTHAGVISQVVGALKGSSAARWEEHRPGNASLSEIAWTGDTGDVIRFDDRSHLEEEVGAAHRS